MNAFYVSVGSNVGDRCRNIERAQKMLSESAGVEVETASGLYEAEAVGPGKHPAFLNGIFGGRTSLAPLAFLEVLHEIEDELGRTRVRRWAPRTMDLDLLMLGGRVMNTPRLTLPHPRMAARRFVLVPLAEIAPELRHPVLNADVATLLDRCGDASWVRPLDRSVVESGPC